MWTARRTVGGRAMRRRWDDEEWTEYLCHDDVLKQVVVKMKTTLNQSCVSSAPPPPDDLPALLTVRK